MNHPVMGNKKYTLVRPAVAEHLAWKAGAALAGDTHLGALGQITALAWIHAIHKLTGT